MKSRGNLGKYGELKVEPIEITREDNLIFEEFLKRLKESHKTMDTLTEEDYDRWDPIDDYQDEDFIEGKSESYIDAIRKMNKDRFERMEPIDFDEGIKYGP